MQIFVHTFTGKNFVLKVKPSLKICKLKAAVDAKAKLRSNETRLIFEREVLIYSNHSLSNYDVTDGKTLLLISHVPLRIFIKTLAGKTIIIPAVEPYDTVQTVKAKIEVKEGTPARQQRLVFAGHKMEDGFTLAHYKISNECVVHLLTRGRGF